MSVLENRKTKRAFRLGFDREEALLPASRGSKRELLATISVNAGQVVRGVDTQLLGVNVAWYDSVLNTPQTQQMVQAAGLTMFRFPGGSSSDDFHFNAAPTYNGEGTDASMASFIASVNGVGLATLDYGSGSPQEAAAFLAYLNAPVGNTTAIGNGQEWNDSDEHLADRSTGRRPATGRACAPRLRWPRTTASTSCGSTTPRRSDIQYWEVGNEEYGSWEIDHHTAQHDPATYIAFAKQFARPRGQDRPDDLDRPRRAAAPAATSTTGPPTSCSSRPARGSPSGS